MRKQIDLTEAIGKKITGIAVNHSDSQAIIALDDDAFACITADNDDFGPNCYLLFNNDEAAIWRRSYDEKKLADAIGVETLEAWLSEEREQAAIREAGRADQERRQLAELIAKYGVPGQ